MGDAGCRARRGSTIQQQDMCIRCFHFAMRLPLMRYAAPTDSFVFSEGTLDAEPKRSSIYQAALMLLLIM